MTGATTSALRVAIDGTIVRDAQSPFVLEPDGPAAVRIADSPSSSSIARLEPVGSSWVLTAHSGGPLTVSGTIVNRLLIGGPVAMTIEGSPAPIELSLVTSRPPSTPAPDTRVHDTRPRGDHERSTTAQVPTPAAPHAPQPPPSPPSVSANQQPAPPPPSPSSLSATQQPAPSSERPAPAGASSANASRTGGGSLVVRGLTVRTKGVTRLDSVDLTMRAGDFVAILGTSGAGKSTLLKALTGTEPATAGSIRLNEYELYDSFAQLRSQIGYVPQEDILHSQLTITETLGFASRLRFPADTSDDERLARVDAVIDELGLTGRADAPVAELSGGQRKRVNVAVELLTEPDLLILDEPTSGLDPGNERHLMEILRSLADGGRMVIVVTHSIESLHLCDELLFLAPGGVPVFSGPPTAMPGSLGAGSLTEVFPTVERLPDATAVRVRPLPPPSHPARAPSGPPRPTKMVDRVKAADPVELGRQFRILTERYVQVLISDRRSLLVLGLQAPIIAVLMLFVFGSGHLAPVGLELHPEAGNVLMALALATIYLGASNAVREVVKERPILRREQNFGVSVAAYLSSKFAVLGVITVAQAGLLVVVGVARQDGPTDALVLFQPTIELLVVIAVCGLSALALGLLISSWASSGDKAMTVLPVMLFVQFLMAGLIFPVSTIGIQQLSWITSARWGFSGAAATTDFWTLRGCGDPTLDVDCSTLWKHEPVNWLISYALLCVLTGVGMYLAWRLIVRVDPVEVLAAEADESEQR